ncbi:Proteasome assembly chaperone 2 [Actinomortierella wolfii]|nr:Proteasome assembly chaperone 2 [Actinomortierella wolfii]
MDLLLSTLDLERVGCIEDENIIPVLGPPDRQGNASELTLTIEVFQTKDGQWTMIQQRSPTVQHCSPQYAKNLLKFIQESKFSKVVLLASADGARRIDIQLAGAPVRYVGSPSLPASLIDTLNSLSIRPLETIPIDQQDQRALAQQHLGHSLYDYPPQEPTVPASSSPEKSTASPAKLADKMQEIQLEGDNNGETQEQLEKVPRIPGGGFARRLHSLCQEAGVAIITLVTFAMEGDNAPDAIFLANVFNAVFKVHVPTAEQVQAGEGWKYPKSWNSLYEITPELVNSTATDFCVYPDCSQQAIALVQNTIVQNCLDGVDVPNDTTTANIVYGVASLYPPLKQGICTRIPNNGTFCVTEFAKSLGDYIRANPSPYGIGIFLNGTVLFDYVSKIPKEVLCTDCTEAIVTPISNFVEKNMLSLRPEIVSWALTAKKATTDKCGATFLDGDIPSFNKGNNSKNDNQPKGAAASLSKSAIQTWNVFSALPLVILALLPL